MSFCPFYSLKQTHGGISAVKEREGKFAHAAGDAQLTTETEWPAETTTTTTTHTHSHTGSHVVFFPMARGLLRKLYSRTCRRCYSSVCLASWQWWWFQPVRALYCNQPEHFCPAWPTSIKETAVAGCLDHQPQLLFCQPPLTKREHDGKRLNLRPVSALTGAAVS